MIPGDANGDNQVDVSDLGILAANYGEMSAATWAMGDFNNDERVDVSDLGILAANYGEGTETFLDFSKDAQIFGLTIDDDQKSSEAVSILDDCSGTGSPIIAGVLLVGLLLLLRLDE